MVLTITEDDLSPCQLEDGKTMIITLTNSGYLLYTLNMLKSLSPYGWDKKIFVICMDSKAYDVLCQRGYHVYNLQKETMGRFFEWNTVGYEEICYWKLASIYHLLSMEKNVILVDGDVVFRKDPVVDWRQWWSDPTHDVWIQNDSQKDSDTTNLCTGYTMIRSTPELRQVYDCVSEEGRKKYSQCVFDNNDQTYFNRFVKPYCHVRALPLKQYPNGKMYLENESSVQNTAVLVHFNWIKGNMKLVTMKRRGMWLLEPDEE
jgi:hypothetical protein